MGEGRGAEEEAAMQDPMGPHSRLAEFRNKVGALKRSRISPDGV